MVLAIELEISPSWLGWLCEAMACVVASTRFKFKALEMAAAAMAEVVNCVYRRTPRNPQGDVQVVCRASCSKLNLIAVVAIMKRCRTGGQGGGRGGQTVRHA